MTKILLVEDDFAIVHSLQEYLNLEGFTSDYASGQKEAEQLLKTTQYQLLLLDVSLKDGDGFAVCNMAQKIQLPVIFLSASSDEETVVRGLNIGADDYITKPFSPKELVLRVNNLIRRIYKDEAEHIKVDGYEIDEAQRIVIEDDKQIDLTTKEFELLMMFVNNRGTAFPREQILSQVWEENYFGSDRVVDDTLRRLRKKMPNLSIHTIYGFGYRLG